MQQPAKPHVYAADQGLQLQNETVEAITYDDAASLLLVIKGGVVFAYDTDVDVGLAGQHEQLVWTYPLGEGPRAVCVRCSLDRQLLALQRSPFLVELVDLPTGNISVMHSDKGRSELLGLFFSEWPEAEVVLVTRAGLELCTFAARRQGLHSRERLRMPIHWYRYSHETRCCLVATGTPGACYLQAWQFVSSGLVTLPAFALTLAIPGAPAAASAPRLVGSAALLAPGLGAGVAPDIAAAVPVSPAVVAAAAAAAAHPNAPQPVPSLPVSRHAGSVAETDDPNKVPGRHEVIPAVRTLSASSPAWGVGGGQAPASTQAWGSCPPRTAVRLLKMYGRVYAAHINGPARKLELYRFYTDTVVLQHAYELYTASVMAIELSVLDNVLCVHQGEAGVVLVIDVCADGQQPVAPPLPLGYLAAPKQQREVAQERLAARLAAQVAGVAPPPTPTTPPALLWAALGAGEVPTRAAWHVYLPNLIVDPMNQVVYRLMLDLPALAAVARDPAVLAAFLARRRATRMHVQLATPALCSSGSVTQLGSVVMNSTGTTAPVDSSGIAAEARSSGEEAEPGASATETRVASESGCNQGVVNEISGERQGGGSEVLDAPGAPLLVSGPVGEACHHRLLRQLLEDAIQRCMPLLKLRRIFDNMCSALTEVLALQPGGPISPTLMPSELCTQVFLQQWAQWEQGQDKSRNPAGCIYLQGVLWEYKASLAATGLALPPRLQLLTLQLLQASRGAQLAIALNATASAPLLPPSTIHSSWPAQQAREQQTQSGQSGVRDAGVETEHNTQQAQALGDEHEKNAVHVVAGQLGKEAALRLQGRAVVTAFAPVEALAGRVPGETTAGQGGGSARGRGGVWQVALGGPAGAASGAQPSAGSLVVRALIQQGHVVRAVRMLRALGISDVPVGEVVAAAIASRDVGVQAAVYRVICEPPFETKTRYPTFEAMMQQGGPQAGGVAV